ncbi:MAG: hypothetical protein IJA15_03565, partial [Clostridia bacterium]|nr:hypothetical protein [Clostridia bacterium]
CYDKGDIYVDMSYYFDGEGYVVDVYVYYLIEMGGGSGGSGSGSGGSGENQDSFTYTDFSASDKSLFVSVFGEVVIPFIANNDYALEEYSYYYEDEDLTETGLNFYTYGNTSAEFSAYREKFSSFTFAESYEDEYGDTWYCYDKGDIYVDMAHYNTEEGYVVDVYVYYLTEGDTSGSGSSGSGSGSGGESGGNAGNENTNLITNAGSGLPTGENGIYHVDFTKAKYVKNVTDQGYYMDGCPTTSANANPSVLVVPVDFSDAPAGVSYPIEKLEKVFNGTVGETDYYSVHDYYFTSSYGKLDIDFTVLNYWFRAENSSTYYKNFTIDYYGDNIAAGDMLLIDEVLKALEPSMDLTKFDSDNNSVIDAIIIVNTLEINSDEDMHWAYRYWNLYTDEQDNYYEYDGVSANDYMWLSYNFMYETYDEEGNVEFTDKTACNTYTFIHEFGHVLGADDYYDTEGINYPLEGCDIMDSMSGDHNPYSKFNYGWLTTSTLITAKESVTLTLNPFTTTGETIIIANNWNEDLGAYQEYYVIAYYTAEGLNGGNAGYFARDGVVVYHVNASLYKDEYDGEVYYDVYNNNTDSSSDYGTEDNLIEYVLSANETFTYVAGDTISSATYDDQGNKIAYIFEVLSIEDGKVTIEFTKNN